MFSSNKVRVIGALLFLLLLWQGLAVFIGNDWLLPYPWEVVKAMGRQMTTIVFYTSLLHTFLRVLSGLCAAFLLAFICAYASFRSSLFQDLFSPFLLLARSIPNISYILIVLVWCSADISAAIICFLILFPTIYSSLYHGWKTMDAKLLRVMELYPAAFCYRLFSVYLPLLKGEVYASLANGLSLAFKVGIMAEIIGQVQTGVGRQMNICRMTFDMSGLFAWTAWIVLLLALVEYVMQRVLRKKLGGEA